MMPPSRRQRSRPSRPVAKGKAKPPSTLPDDAPAGYRGDPRALGELLGRAEPATRARTVQRLQGEQGNAVVQRLLTGLRTPGDVVQRQPGGPTDTKKTWLQPFPSTIPRIKMPATDYDRIRSTLTGHPWIGSMPVATEADKALIQKANPYFESTPLQPWESAEDAGPEYLAERNRLTDMFQLKAYHLALYTLEQSDLEAKNESAHYSSTPGFDNPEIADFKQAAQHLAQVQDALITLGNTQDVLIGWSLRTMRRTTVDHYLGKPPPLEPVPAANEPKGDDEFAVASRAAIEQFPAAAAKFTTLREVYGARFPVLLGANQDYTALASLDAAGINTYVQAQTGEVRENIMEARRKLTPEKVWSLPIVIAQTKQLLGIAEGTGANDAIQGKLDDIAVDKVFHSLAMAGLQLGLQVVAGMLTGGASLLVQGAAIGVGAVGVAEEVENYKFAKTMSSRIALDSATKLAAEDPGYFWLAVSIAGLGLDIGFAAATFKSVVAPLKAADALADTTKAAKALAAGEDAAKKTIATMADVEEVARAQARMLKQEGKLAEGLTEELFVERIMSGLRRQVATQGQIAQDQAKVVATVLNKSHPQYAKLVAGDRSALTTLLTEHGEWKTLVSSLERGGERQIAESLVAERRRVIGEIAAEVKGLSKEKVPAEVKPMSGGSEELVSDVDLQIIGADAGQMLIEAEAYLARRFGDSWSSMFRMNLYTEGNRLIRYQEVLAGLRPNQRVAMTQRINALTERLTFAKMLAHAGDDPAAVGRIEALAQQAGVGLEDLRALGKVDEAARQGARNRLLQEVDALQKEYETATGARKVELGEEITTKQMEANFYTHEANIGPASLKTTKTAGLELREGYQAALTQLEMIEHILAMAGGDVAKASREYELFKYIGRFARAAEQAGKDTPQLRFLRNYADAVSAGNRELMENTSHVFLDPLKMGKGPRPNEFPQFGGATPPVRDEFLVDNFRMFSDEAEKALAALNPTGARRLPPAISAPAVPRSGRTTAPMSTADATTAAKAAEAANEGAGGVYATTNHSTPDRYLVIDNLNKRFSSKGHLEEGGELSLSIRTVLEDGSRSTVLRGEPEFNAIMNHFGGRVSSIRGAWTYGSNLETFNKLVREGKSVEDAARGTWTGEQAARFGFTKVTVRAVEGPQGMHSKVSVLFHR